MTPERNLTPAAIALYMGTLAAAVHDQRRLVREVTANDSREIRHMLRNAGIRTPAPWCAAFVQDCSDSAAVAAGLTNPLDAVKLEALVASYADWAREAGKVCTYPTQARPGALVLFNFGGLRWDHIGIVAVPPERDAAGTTFQTIEGNTSSGDAGSQRDGDGVFRRTRKIIPARTLFVAWAE